MWMSIVAGLAVLIVVVLAVVAWRLQTKVWVLNRRQAEMQRVLQAEEVAQRERTNKSIQLLAQGVLDDQLTLTEASIRIKVLLDSLNVDIAIKEEYLVFYQLAQATDHIPILGEWKKLSRRQQRAFDREREALEEKYRSFVVDAVQRIRGWQF